MNLTDIRLNEHIPVKNAEGKENLVAAILYAHELARKNSLKGNMTASSYACGVVLDDNSVYFGVNFNATRNEISSICAERLAILSAFNEKLKNYTCGEKFNYKIKYILITNYINDKIIYSEKVTPCADCLSWLNAGNNISSDTKILSLKKNANEEIYLDEQPLTSFLPLRNLSFEIPECDFDFPNLKYKKLFNAVLRAYKNNPLSKTSGQNIAAGVLSSGKIFTGIKIDYSKRWFTEPLECAAIKAIEKFGLNTKIDAICYIGDEYTITETGQKVRDGLISIKTLGRLLTKFITPDTSIITVQNGKIDIRKVDDFLPNEHQFIHAYQIH